MECSDVVKDFQPRFDVIKGFQPWLDVIEGFQPWLDVIEGFQPYHWVKESTYNGFGFRVERWGRDRVWIFPRSPVEVFVDIWGGVTTGLAGFWGAGEFEVSMVWASDPDGCGFLPSIGRDPADAPSRMWAILQEDQWKLSSLSRPSAWVPILTSIVDLEVLLLISNGPSNLLCRLRGFALFT